MPQAQGLHAGDATVLKNKKSLTAQWMKGMGDLRRTQRLFEEKCVLM